MKLASLFLEQLDRETASTRRALQQVPEGVADWKPHEKSMPLGYLATLVATMPSWIAMIVDREFLDLAQGAQPKAPSSNRELVKIFDDSVAAARRALEDASDEHLAKPWQLRVAGKVVDEKSRYATIADTFGHIAHHRGQLTVYLRLNDRPVPSIYGPTADEKW
ncbi:MAG TPA: DinB family protein [Thermoanaerobaculia bacterium]|nr:DinB family protein [Thermoanaerobaculia bacterium]